MNEERKTHAAICDALSDETRLQLFELICRYQGNLCVLELEERIGTKTQPTINYHLRLLREAGLIEEGRKGLYNYYSPCFEQLHKLEALLKMLIPSEQEIRI